MKNSKPATPFTPHEIRRFISPLTITTVVILSVMTLDAILGPYGPNYLLVIFGSLGIAYVTTIHSLIVQSAFRLDIYRLVNSILAGLGLGILSFFIPETTNDVMHVLVIFSAVAIATTAGRAFAYLALLLITMISFLANLPQLSSTEGLLGYTAPILVSVVVLEVIIRIKDTTQQHIHRLETINRVSREIMQTLDTEKTISLLDKTIRDALDADTYFIGILRDGQIHLELFCDEGKYFNGMRVPLEGTL